MAMLLAQVLGLGIVLPALVTLGAAFALARVVRVVRTSPMLVFGGPATAVALGYLAAHLALHGFRGVYPADVMQRLPLVAVAVAAVAWLEGHDAPLARRIALDSLVAGAMALLLLGPLWEAFGASRFLFAVLGLALVTVAVSRSLHVVLGQPRQVLATLGLSVLAGIIALLCAATGTAMVAQLVGAVAASTAALAALGSLSGDRQTASHVGAARVVAVLLTSCLVLAHFYAEMNAQVALAAALALATPGAFRSALKQNSRWGASLGWTASVLAFAFAAWGATRTTPGAPSVGEYDYGYQ